MAKNMKVTVMFRPLEDGPKNYRKREQPTNPPQARFIVRLALALHRAGANYNIEWLKAERDMIARLTAADVPPSLTIKPFEKPPRPKIVSDWKPRIIEAEYRPQAWTTTKSGTRTWKPGHVILHSSGIGLVRAADSEELTVHMDGSGIDQGWTVTHMASGCGIGLDGEMSFKRAITAANAAIAFASSVDLDLTLGEDDLKARRGDTRGVSLAIWRALHPSASDSSAPWSIRAAQDEPAPEGIAA